VQLGGSDEMDMKVSEGVFACSDVERDMEARFIIRYIQEPQARAFAKKIEIVLDILVRSGAVYSLSLLFTGLSFVGSGTQQRPAHMRR
jgi:hypothetical protein